MARNRWHDITKHAKWYALRWLAAWGQFLTGLAAVVTFGCYWPAWGAKTDNWFLTCAEKQLFESTKEKP